MEINHSKKISLSDFCLFLYVIGSLGLNFRVCVLLKGVITPAGYISFKLDNIIISIILKVRTEMVSD